jgi:methyl-accepting chemotaxis protein
MASIQTKVSQSALKVQEMGAKSGQIGSIVETIEEVASQTAGQMKTAMGELVNLVLNVSTVADQDTSATSAMPSLSLSVASAMENVAAVSEENTASVEEVSASAEELSAQVEEVTTEALSLAEMAQVLQDVVDRFVLPAAVISLQAPHLRKEL